MTAGVDIRESTSGDVAAIEALYRDAFPDEDLVPLVRDLLQEPAGVLSLVAEVGAALVGHAAFTRCALAGDRDAAALLGPLAVAPAHQRQGLGSALVREGLRRSDDVGVRHVCVLGDPAWYGRLGFGPEARVRPPYELPPAWRDAWQSLRLGGATAPPVATLDVPEPWRRPALWAP